MIFLSVCLYLFSVRLLLFLFFFNATATTEIYTLSLHDALPIRPPSMASPRSGPTLPAMSISPPAIPVPTPSTRSRSPDRKSTRLNSSHLGISYAVFCLKKKKKKKQIITTHVAQHQQAHAVNTLI